MALAIMPLLLCSNLLNTGHGQKPNPFEASDKGQSFQTSAVAPCSKLAVSSVKASGTQEGLSSGNVVDNDVTSRWSNLGLNSWVQLDLGKQFTICNAEIAWYKGNERVNDFTIAASNDGI